MLSRMRLVRVLSLVTLCRREVVMLLNVLTSLCRVLLFWRPKFMALNLYRRSLLISMDVLASLLRRRCEVTLMRLRCEGEWAQLKLLRVILKRWLLKLVLVMRTLILISLATLLRLL